jgi:amino acid permease
MAFLILGRSAIFIISAGLFIQSFGLIIIFFNVFGSTASTVYKSASGNTLGEESMFAEPTVWIVGLATLLFPSILMKELAELKIVSLSLFAAAIIFVLINISSVFVQGIYNEPGEVQYFVPQEFGSKDFIQSIVVMFTACNFQVNLFPIHSHQIDKSVEATVKYISFSMLLVQSLYFSLAIACIFMFGSSVQESVLVNIG